MHPLTEAKQARSLIGALCPFYADTGQPVLALIDEFFCVPTFDTEAQLRQYIDRLQLAEGTWCIKQITGNDFIDSITAGGAGIAHNLRMEGDRSRWTEIIPTGGASA